MYPMISENDSLRITETYIAMPDGVRLYTRIVIPKGTDSLPIVFIRTPYEKSHGGLPHSPEEYAKDLYLQNGYAIVLQHCRGTGDSEGICIPYQEKEDGLNTLSYLRTLPFYNGEIFLTGGSYLATVHLSYLSEAPSDIKGAALSIQTDRMYFRNYRNGCNYSFNNLDWWLGMMKRQYPTPDPENTIRRPYVDLMKRIVGEDVPRYTDGLLHDTYDAYWQEDPRTFAMEQLQIPILLTEGWYDFYIEGMFSMWERLPAATKQQSALIVGPWGHSTQVRNAEYPLPNGNLPEDFIVEWFNSIRKGRLYPYAKCNKVNYYSIGGDYWTSAEYPVREPARRRYYFHPGNRLNENPFPEAAGDTACTDHSCADRSGTDLARTGLTYTYDPDRRLNCFPYHNIYKAAPMHSVDGVLSFQSDAFTEEINYYGEIRWHMPVSSDCEDTAFFIRIYFTEDGESYNLTETITSLSHFCTDYQPGSTVMIDVKTPPIAFTAKPGTRIRVDIASDGGIYVPHANVKGHWATVTECRTAHNTVYLHDAFIELPVADCTGQR